MPSRATWKLATLAVRSIQLVLSFVAMAVFVHLLTMPFSNTPRTELVVLLVVTIATLFQTSSASIFTFLAREKLWVGGLDLVCICGAVTTAVMARGISQKYGCGTAWLPQSGGMGIGDMIERRVETGRNECTHLRGVFGIAIVQSVLMLVTFLLVVCAIRARKIHDFRLKGLTEKHWRDATADLRA